MTSRAFLNRMTSWAETLKLAAFTIAAMWFAITSVAAVAWSLWRAYDGREWLQGYLGITELSVRIAGEDRVLQTRAEGTYALTPVSRKAPVITATFAVRRTAAGAPCTAVRATAMFEGQMHIPRVGVMLNEIRQVGREWTPVEVQAEVPVRLAIGAAWMWIVMDYDCPEGRRTDQTDSVRFDFTE